MADRIYMFYSHDDIAKILELPALPFDVMYPDRATYMKRSVLEYVKALRDAHTTGVDQSHAGQAGADTGVLAIDPNGFPVAPRTHSWKKVTKGDLEPLYRCYITQHYSTWHY
jgi:hypothetical protein